MGVEMREYEDECWDAMGCDGMRWDALGCVGMRWDAMGCDGIVTCD
jgi:hypothetical protein